MDFDIDDCKPRQTFYTHTNCNPLEVLYQRRCAKYIYVVPEGLRELMSDITREVLRCQPLQMYCFIADYLDALLVTRENAKVAALFVEDVTEAGSTLREILEKTDLSLEQAVRACRIIQRAFRRHLDLKRETLQTTPIDPYMIICKMMVRLKITYDEASQAARIIQRAWRIYRMRMEIWRDRFQTAVDWRTACRYTLRLYKKYAATWEYTRAATIIQAAYRGYYTRRLLKLYAQKRYKIGDDIMLYLKQTYEEPVEEDIGSEQTLYILYDPEDKAARIIQRSFKKFIEQKRGTKDSIKPEELPQASEALPQASEALPEAPAPAEEAPEAPLESPEAPPPESPEAPPPEAAAPPEETPEAAPEPSEAPVEEVPQEVVEEEAIDG